jgi:uroporphyrinogen decarboxylase
MRDEQWQIILDLIDGRPVLPRPAGFIIDSPWLPGWAGISTLDYFSSDGCWFEANKKAVQTFSDIIFLPGFWAEFGMCTEPSAFGAKCTFHRNELPFADKVIFRPDDIDRLTVPHPETDGLAPFVLNRLCLNRTRIEALGHKIRFAVARGPLNIASFLMGTTEFLMSLRTDTDKIHTLLNIITEYIVRWLDLQKKTIDSIDGVFILDDIVGFCGEPDFREFAAPYLRRIFNCLDVSVKFFHNDADGRGCAGHLSSLGVNLFNFSFLHSLEEMKTWTNNQVVLLGNIPPRDVMALGTPDDVRRCVREALGPGGGNGRILLSCGGGMPDGVSTENIRAFLEAVQG